MAQSRSTNREHSSSQSSRADCTSEHTDSLFGASSDASKSIFADILDGNSHGGSSEQGSNMFTGDGSAQLGGESSSSFTDGLAFLGAMGLSQSTGALAEDSLTDSGPVSLSLNLADLGGGAVGVADLDRGAAPAATVGGPRLAHGGIGGFVASPALFADPRKALLNGLPADTARLRVLELEEEVAHLDRCRKLLENELYLERKRHVDQSRAAEARWLEQVASLRQQLDMTDAHRDALEKHLEDKKEALRDLIISDTLAQELAARPPDELTLKEYVSLKLHNMVSAANKETERLRLELQKTQEQLLATSEVSELQLREAARAKRMAQSREESMQVEMDSLQLRLADTMARAKRAEDYAEELVYKGQEYDRMEARAEVAERELEACRSLADRQAQALVDLTESEGVSSRRVGELERRLQMTDADKTYLQRELTDVQLRCDHATRDLEAKQHKVRELKRVKDTLTEELMRSREKCKTEYEERFAAEMSRLQEQSAKELADIRATSREVFERENRALREARKEALGAAERLRKQVADLSATHEDLVMRVSKSEAVHEAALSELRSDLRMKSFELSQLGVAYEERCGSLRQLELECELLKQQLDVHRTEFSRLEASSSRRASELQLLLDSERDKVRMFEELEMELDSAVVRAGHKMLEYGGEGPEFGVTALDVVPTAPQRRVRQAIRLAHKLLEKERELELTKRQLQEWTSRADALGQRADEAEQRLANTQQPTKYMVDTIREREAELDGLRGDKRRLQTRVHALEQAHSDALAEKKDMQRELRRVLDQRQDMAALQAMLADIRQSERPPVPVPIPVSAEPSRVHRASPPLSQASPVAPVDVFLPDALLPEMLTHRTSPVCSAGSFRRPSWYQHSKHTAS